MKNLADVIQASKVLAHDYQTMKASAKREQTALNPDDLEQLHGILRNLDIEVLDLLVPDLYEAMPDEHFCEICGQPFIYNEDRDNHTVAECLENQTTLAPLMDHLF